MGSLLAYLRSRFFWLNVIAAIIMVMLLLGLTYHWLNKYTHHGETITVPELRKKNISELGTFLKYKQLNFSVSDSSIYDIKLSPGTIIEQDPKPNEKVKEGRTIYVTITRFNAPEILMPDLIDGSYRQAEKILQSLGIKIGETIYKPDLAKMRYWLFR
ncbi:MAG: PASTA domain-containing protein [Bacteroidetes bacterium]|nr:PASTA domain-containing protein [Bacteroidota bacterium]